MDRKSAETTAIPLFRSEAIKFQAARLQGEVLVKIRSPWLLLGCLSAGLVFVVVVVAAFATYSRKEPVWGALVLAEGTPGQTVAREEAIVDLVPKQGQLEAELTIPPSSIGLIKAGQIVLLRYDAFPYRRFGSARGKIKSISLVSLPPQQTIGSAALRPQAAYRARVTLEQDFIYAFGEKVPLRQGMSFKADVILGRESLLEWLFEPLYQFAGRSS